MSAAIHQQPITLACPAKLNLTLAVAPPRADGLHPIASVMVALRFSDTLTLNALTNGPSTFTRRLASDAPRPQPIDWPIESDLAFRAHALMQAEAGHALPIDCTLDKRIPAGAGLGGGSSDAAGMLVGLRELFGLATITDDRLLALGRSLGADVCFLVHAMLGRRAALATGIGEQIQAIDHLPAFEAVLIFPRGACPTGAVYKAFDAGLPNASTSDLTACAASWLTHAGLPEPHNDLQAAAESVCPAIGDARSTLQALGLAPRLTGSGSALFVLAENPSIARQIALQAHHAGLPACVTGYDATISRP